MWPFSRKPAPAPEATEKSVSGVPSQGMLPTLGASASVAGVLVSQATAMTDPTVFACVTRRAEDFARCRPRLVRDLPDGSWEEVTDHPVAKLFKRPNRLQTWFEFAEQMEAAHLLRGNAYAPVLRDRRGSPTEMLPVNPDAVMVLESSDGNIFYNVNRVGLFQIAALRDLPVSINAEDVLHLRGLAFNMTVGVGRITLARDLIGVVLGLLQQIARWMANGARPSGVLKSAKSLTLEAAKRLKASWESLFVGVQNVGAVAVLEDGVEWQSMSFDADDLQFTEQRKATAIDVCRFFGMPPHKVGVVDGMSKLNQPQADQAYVNEVIMPTLERWEQKLAHFFDLDAEGLRVSFDETALLRADPVTRINMGRMAVLSSLMTPEEWRISERMPPKPKYGVLRAPLNTAPLGTDMTGAPDEGGGRPEGSPNKDEAEK